MYIGVGSSILKRASHQRPIPRENWPSIPQYPLCAHNSSAGVGLSSPSGTMLVVLTDLTLHGSCVGNQLCFDFVCAIVIACSDRLFFETKSHSSWLRLISTPGSPSAIASKVSGSQAWAAFLPPHSLSCFEIQSFSFLIFNLWVLLTIFALSL